MSNLLVFEGLREILVLLQSRSISIGRTARYWTLTFTALNNKLLTLVPRTFYSLAYFTPWNTLLPQIFAMPWLTYIPNIQQRIEIFTLKLDSESCFIYLFHIMVKWIPRIIMCWGAKCSREKRVLRSKVFQGAKGVGEQSVLRGKECWGGRCNEE